MSQPLYLPIISRKFGLTFLSNPGHGQIDRQTDKQTETNA